MAASSSSSCKSLTSKPAKQSSTKPVRSSEESELGACATFCNASQRNIVLKFNQPAHLRKGGTVAGEFDATPTKKAERERLRRDRLNEKLLELAGALEPDRPKNDKSTILGDAIQTLKDLMTDVERLRAEHTLLVDESQDLSQEKKDLLDEKSQLTSKVERLQCQMYQQMHAMLLWRTADPTGMMGAGSFPYPVTSPHGATDVDAGLQQPLAPGHPFVGQPQTNLYVPVPLVPGVHPALQAHHGYGGRGAPYFPYPFNFSHGPSLAEVPSAQVPHSLQPVSRYPLEVHQSPLMHPMQSFLQAATYPQADGPGFTTIQPSIPESHYAFDAGTTMGATMPSSHHTVQDPVSSPLKVCNNEQYANNPQLVQTALQLQTPASLANAQLQWSQ